MTSLPTNDQYAFSDPSLYLTKVTIDDFPVVKAYLLKVKGKLPNVNIYLRYSVHPKCEIDDVATIYLDGSLFEHLSEQHQNYCAFHELWHAYGYDDDDPVTGSIKASEDFCKANNYDLNTRAELLNFIERTKLFKVDLIRIVKGDPLASSVLKLAEEHKQNIRLIGPYLRELICPVTDELLKTKTAIFIVKQDDICPDFLDATAKIDTDKSLEFIIEANYNPITELTIDGLETDGKYIIDRTGAVADLFDKTYIRINPKYYAFLKAHKYNQTDIDDPNIDWQGLFDLIERYKYSYDNSVVAPITEKILDYHKQISTSLFDGLSNAKIIIFHGTSDKFLDKIHKEGMKSSQNLNSNESRHHALRCIFFTTSKDYATSFAKHSSRKYGGNAVVIGFEVPLSEIVETRLLTGTDSIYSLWANYIYYNERSNPVTGKAKSEASFQNPMRFRFSTRFKPKKTHKAILEGLLPIRHIGSVIVDELTVFDQLAPERIYSVDTVTDDYWADVCKRAESLTKTAQPQPKYKKGDRVKYVGYQLANDLSPTTGTVLYSQYDDGYDCNVEWDDGFKSFVAEVELVPFNDQSKYFKQSQAKFKVGDHVKYIGEFPLFWCESGRLTIYSTDYYNETTKLYGVITDKTSVNSALPEDELELVQSADNEKYFKQAQQFEIDQPVFIIAWEEVCPAKIVSRRLTSNEWSYLVESPNGARDRYSQAELADEWQGCKPYCQYKIDEKAKYQDDIVTILTEPYYSAEANKWILNVLQSNGSTRLHFDDELDPINLQQDRYFKQSQKFNVGDTVQTRSNIVSQVADVSESLNDPSRYVYRLADCVYNYTEDELTAVVTNQDRYFKISTDKPEPKYKIGQDLVFTAKSFSKKPIHNATGYVLNIEWDFDEEAYCYLMAWHDEAIQSIIGYEYLIESSLQPTSVGYFKQSSTGSLMGTQLDSKISEYSPQNSEDASKTNAKIRKGAKSGPYRAIRPNIPRPNRSFNAADPPEYIENEEVIHSTFEKCTVVRYLGFHDDIEEHVYELQINSTGELVDCDESSILERKITYFKQSSTRSPRFSLGDEVETLPFKDNDVLRETDVIRGRITEIERSSNGWDYRIVWGKANAIWVLEPGLKLVHSDSERYFKQSADQLGLLDDQDEDERSRFSVGDYVFIFAEDNGAIRVGIVDEYLGTEDEPEDEDELANESYLVQTLDDSKIEIYADSELGTVLPDGTSATPPSPILTKGTIAQYDTELVTIVEGPFFNSDAECWQYKVQAENDIIDEANVEDLVPYASAADSYFKQSQKTFKLGDIVTDGTNTGRIVVIRDYEGRVVYYIPDEVKRRGNTIMLGHTLTLVTPSTIEQKFSLGEQVRSIEYPSSETGTVRNIRLEPYDSNNIRYVVLDFTGKRNFKSIFAEDELAPTDERSRYFKQSQKTFKLGDIEAISDRHYIVAQTEGPKFQIGDEAIWTREDAGFETERVAVSIVKVYPISTGGRKYRVADAEGTNWFVWEIQLSTPNEKDTYFKLSQTKLKYTVGDELQDLTKGNDLSTGFILSVNNSTTGEPFYRVQWNDNPESDEYATDSGTIGTGNRIYEDKPRYEVGEDVIYNDQIVTIDVIIHTQSGYSYRVSVDDDWFWLAEANLTSTKIEKTESDRYFKLAQKPFKLGDIETDKNKNQFQLGDIETAKTFKLGDIVTDRIIKESQNQFQLGDIVRSKKDFLDVGDDPGYCQLEIRTIRNDPKLDTEPYYTGVNILSLTAHGTASDFELIKKSIRPPQKFQIGHTVNTTFDDTLADKPSSTFRVYLIRVLTSNDTYIYGVYNLNDTTDRFRVNEDEMIEVERDRYFKQSQARTQRFQLGDIVRKTDRTAPYGTVVRVHLTFSDVYEYFILEWDGNAITPTYGVSLVVDEASSELAAKPKFKIGDVVRSTPSPDSPEYTIRGVAYKNLLRWNEFIYELKDNNVESRLAFIEEKDGLYLVESEQDKYFKISSTPRHAVGAKVRDIYYDRIGTVLRVSEGNEDPWYEVEFENGISEVDANRLDAVEDEPIDLTGQCPSERYFKLAERRTVCS